GVDRFLDLIGDVLFDRGLKSIEKLSGDQVARVSVNIRFWHLNSSFGIVYLVVVRLSYSARSRVTAACTPAALACRTPIGPGLIRACASSATGWPSTIARAFSKQPPR